jgi:hypothetical protein
VAKEAFSQARYEDALLLYEALLREDPSNAHLWYSNRSACFVKLGEHSRAGREGAFSVELAPDWPRAHGRAIRACLCQFDADGASRALKGYRKAIESDAASSASAADLTLLHSVEKEVNELLERCPIPRIDPAKFACFKKVMHIDSVVVVDSTGCGDFTSLREALLAASERKVATSIIVTSGTHFFLWLQEARFEHLQIIGDGEVFITKAATGHNRPLVIACDKLTRIVLTDLKLDNSALLGHSNESGHCVFLTRGAHVNLTECNLRPHMASCAVDGFSGATLVRCKAEGPGSAILCTDYATVDARGCQFSGSRPPCVEIRSLGSCSLTHCTL